MVAGSVSGERVEPEASLPIASGAYLPAPFHIPGPALIGTLSAAIESSEVVHLHSVWNGMITIAGMLCRRRRRPMLLSPRGMLDRHNMRRRGWFKQAYLRLVERANLEAMAGFHFLDESEFQGCDWLQAVGRVPRIVQPNGLDHEDLRQRLARVSPGVLRATVEDPEAFHLVFLGRLNVIKGLELQVELLSELRRAGVNAHLHWIGPDDGEGESLRRRASALAVDPYLHALGPIYGDERLRWLQEADAVLLTSHYECNSVMAAEAMSVGAVLLATDTCHLDQAQAAGAACVVPRSLHALRDAATRLLSDSGAAESQRRRPENMPAGT